MAKGEEKSLLEKASPLFVVLSIVLAFFVGTLWQKVKNLEKGDVKGEKSETSTSPSQPDPGFAKVDMDTIRGLFDKDVIKFGSKDSKLIFVEISDASCPFCSIASGKNPELNNTDPRFKLVKDGGAYQAPVEEIKNLVDQGKASFVYIYFPGHGAGEMGAKALYCAYEIDKFWPVHDLLMSSAGYKLLNEKVGNDKTKSGELAQFLKSAIDPAKLKECLDSGKYDSRISSDMILASSLGIQGTPGFFVNENRFDGAYSFSDMEPLVKSIFGE